MQVGINDLQVLQVKQERKRKDQRSKSIHLQKPTLSHPRASYSDAFDNASKSDAHGTLLGV